MTKENLMAIVGTNLRFYRTMRHMTQEQISNIMVLLQDKSTAYLNWLEQLISIPGDAFPKSG